MSRVLGYTSLVLALAGFCLAENYYFYHVSRQDMQQRQQAYEEQVRDQVQVQVSQQVEEKTKAWEAEQSLATASQNQVLTQETVYQVQIYDKTTNTLSTDYKKLPQEMVGYTREDAKAYCENYLIRMSAQEYLKGLQAMTVVSFSSDKLTVRKSYDQSQVKYRYYLIADQGQVVVYYGDQKTIYEKTGIETKNLTREDRLALKNGMEVKDEKELFSILENYSS